MIRKIFFPSFLGKSKAALAAWCCMGIIILMALFANVLATEKPLFCKYKGQYYFPAFQFASMAYEPENPAAFNTGNWKELDYEQVLFAPVPFTAEGVDYQNSRFRPPLCVMVVKDKKFYHLLGTTALGGDVFAGIIHGAGEALYIGFISMLIAGSIGLLLGIIAGYFGDEKLRMSRARFLLFMLSVPLAWFYAFYVRRYEIEDALSGENSHIFSTLILSISVFLFIIILVTSFSTLIKRTGLMKKKVKLPTDIIISRLMEVMGTIPRMLLLFLFAAFLKPSVSTVVIIIGLTSWVDICRFARAELLKVRTENYIEAAAILSYPWWRILIFHVLPNSLPAVIITLTYGISGAILAESTLSFLNIGVPADVVTWGSLLAHSRESLNAWWVAVYPGLAVFLTVVSLSKISEKFSDTVHV